MTFIDQMLLSRRNKKLKGFNPYFLHKVRLVLDKGCLEELVMIKDVSVQ